MLLTPLIKRQLAIFGVLSAGALTLTSVRYAQLPAEAGIGVHEVSVDFADASGLYSRAQVTYRGVQVGKVTALEVHESGARATLRLEDDVEIPADAVAELHSTSAIGEQYVDLVAPDGDGPFLDDGATIPVDRTVEMPQITPVLESLNRLLASVPRDETRAVLDGIGAGLAHAGRDVGGLVDQSDRLLRAAQENVDATTDLLAAATPVLATQRDLAGSTRDYAAALRALSGALAAEDSADLRALLRNGPDGLDELARTAEGLQPVLPMLMANLTSNAEVLNTYLPQLRETLVVYPVTASRLQAAVNPRAAYGDVQLDLRATFGNPPTCQSGYLPAGERRSPGDTTTRDVDILAHCEIPSSDPTAVRGARNLPCPDSSRRGPVPASCGLRFGSGIWPGDSGSVAYDLVMGRSSDRQATLTGRPAEDGGTADLWKILVLAPLETR